LYRHASALDPSTDEAVTARSSWEDKRTEAWTTIQARLLAAGRRPWLVISPSALREPTLELWLSLCWEELSTRDHDSYSAAAMRHRDRFEAAWKRVQLAYDEDDDDVVDPDKKSSPGRIFFLG
jgi:hypothetical protein